MPSRTAPIAAVSATLALLVAMFVGRFTLGTPLLPELLAQQSFALVTPRLFTAVVRLFGFWAKWVAFALAVLAYGGWGVGLGWWYARALAGRTRLPGLASGWLFGVGLWLVTMAIGLPLLGAGLFGARLRQGPVTAGVALLAYHLLYGGLLGWLARSPSAHATTSGSDQALPDRSGRRALLRQLAGLPVLWLAAAGAGSWLIAMGTRLAGAATLAFEAIKGLSPEVTPTAKFYTISKNLFDPTPNPRTWRLKIRGLVEHPLTLSLDELKAMPAHEAYVTFVCISNEVGGDLIGNALWKGVPLRHLLGLAGVKPGARKVVLRADDGYSTGVPLERCLHPQTFLAYEMNGAPLPDKHGFPLRAVIPGYYGMKQPKWLTEIEVVDHDYQGYWEERGWADEAVVKTMSRIDVPRHRSQLTPTGEVIAGIAFAGDRGIQRVEYSVDGGQSWQEAQVKAPLSAYSWVLWAAPLALPEGSHLLAVRAVDGQGQLQDPRPSEPLPDGASGYHRLRIAVKGR
jgi:DMSO/TMAO reductase YedYZ molybdopterin-dependent catalytic subunit